ncbi:MAG: hypothetical protein ACRYFS_13495 [Janthinobacterium lividum]
MKFDYCRLETQHSFALMALTVLSALIASGCHSQPKIVVLSSSDQTYFQEEAQASRGDITTLSQEDQAKLQKLYGAQAGPMIKYQYQKSNH